MYINDEQAKAQIASLSRQANCELVTWQGLRVCWRRFGSGQPLVLLHGGHGSWLHWVRNIEAMSARYTVWVPDLPGFGDSDAPASGGLPSLLEPTLATLNQLVGANTPIDLVGFSFGGLVAAHLAAQRPHVRRLALLGPAGHGGRRRPIGVLQHWKDAAQQSGEPAALATAMRHNLAIHMLHAPALEIDSLAVRIHTDACLRTRFRSKDISQGAGLAATLAQRGGLTWLAWGEHDVTADPKVVSRALSEGSSNRYAQVIEGAGHWVQYERSDEVNRLLLTWLSADLAFS